MEWLESEEFYNLMQAYRHASVLDQAYVVEAFEEVKDEIRKNIAQWQPIETAPKDGTEIIVMYVHIETQIVHNAFYSAENDFSDPSEVGWWTYVHSEVSRTHLTGWMTPTHWMPLPPPHKD